MSSNNNTSGQGNACFSWSQELTAAFPDEAKQFEKDMHGGFNEVRGKESQ